MYWQVTICHYSVYTVHDHEYLSEAELGHTQKVISNNRAIPVVDDKDQRCLKGIGRIRSTWWEKITSEGVERKN